MCPWDFAMSCGKSFIRFVFLQKNESWLEALTSLLSFIFYSFLFIPVSDSFLSLILFSDCRTQDIRTLGRDFLSVCDIKYAHPLSLDRAPSFSLVGFYVLTHTITNLHTHLWALITASNKLLWTLHIDPLVTVCWKKNCFVLCGIFNKSLGAFVKTRKTEWVLSSLSTHAEAEW